MEPILFTPFVGAGLAFLVFLFFKTDFVYEYFTLFKLNKYFKNLPAADYEAWKEKDENFGHYLPVYIRTHYNSFWSRLLGCPICLISFLSLGAAPFINVFYFPIIGFFGLLSYTILVGLYKKI